MHETWRVLFDLFALGSSVGFFIVPLYALIQLRSAPEQRARIIAANNILNALFMVCRRAGGCRTAWRWALDSGAVRRRRAVQCGGGGLHLQPGARVHAALHRLAADPLGVPPAAERAGEHSARGPAVLVCNHVSFVDPLVIAAASRRPIRFVMDYRIYRTPLISFVFRHMHAIPIAPAQGRRGDDGGRFRGSGARRSKRANWWRSFPKGGSPTPASSIPSGRACSASSGARRCR
jgi:hypothetical protein